MDPYQPPDDRDLDNPYAPPRSTLRPGRNARSAVRRHARSMSATYQLDLDDFQGPDVALH